MPDLVYVKPNPAEPAYRTLRHPASGSLLDAFGNVPDAGRPWDYDGFTCRMLIDRAVLRADDPVFAKPPAAPPAAEPAPSSAPEADTPAAPPK